MTTNLINTGRGRRVVHFDESSLKDWKCEKKIGSRLIGRDWRKQQKELLRQKKMAEEQAAAEADEENELNDLRIVYDILRMDENTEKVLDLAREKSFKKLLDEFLVAAGAPEPKETIREKLKRFQNKRRSRILDDTFLSRTYVRSALFRIRYKLAFRLEFNLFPDRSASESDETPATIMSAKQKHVLQQAPHGAGLVVAKHLHEWFADTTSTGDDSSATHAVNKSSVGKLHSTSTGDDSTATHAINKSSVARLIPHNSVLLLGPEHKVNGADGVLKVAAANSKAKSIPPELGGASLKSDLKACKTEDDDEEDAKIDSSWIGTNTHIEIEDIKKRAITESFDPNGSAKKQKEGNNFAVPDKGDLE